MLTILPMARSHAVELWTLADHVARLDTLRQQIVVDTATWPAGAERRQVDITCPKLLFGKDARIRLIRIDDQWILGGLRAPDFHDHAHAVRVESWQTERQRGADQLTASIAIDLVEGDGWDRELGALERLRGHAQIPARLTLQGRITDGRLTATFTLAPRPFPAADEDDDPPPNPLPAATGDATGTWSETIGWKPAERPAAWSEDGDARRYRTAQQLEIVAERLYRELRALALVRRDKLAFHAALQTTGRFACRRPDLDVKATKQKPVVKKEADADEDLLDVLDAVVEQDAELDGATLKKIEREMTRIVDRAAGLRRLAEAWVDDPDANVALQDQALWTEDPAFGPWYGEERLPYDAKRGVHRLPDDVGAAGDQHWPTIGTWRYLGPFPRSPDARPIPHLPDTVFDLDRSFTLDRTRLHPKISLKGITHCNWITLEQTTTTGNIAPPIWSAANGYSQGRSTALMLKYGHSGVEWTTSYATTILHSPKDVTVWASIGINRSGQLWMDDRLVWAGPATIDERAGEHLTLVRLPLKKGANRLLVRNDVDFSSPWFAMKICVRGTPRDAATAQASEAAIAAAREDLPEVPAFAFRGDGTGEFPDATPPLAWNYKTGANIAWQTPLPYWANSQPILAEDRLFVTVEPHWLYCLARDDGRVLWKRAVTVLDHLDGPAKTEGWQLYERWQAARQARDAVPTALMREHKWLLRANWWYWQEGEGIYASGDVDERAGASPELLALLDQRDELRTADDPNAVQGQLSQVNERIAKMKQAQAADNPAMQEAVAKEAELRTAYSAFISFLGKHSRVKRLGGYWIDYDGWAFASPVTDGSKVWWKNGMGAVACFDMDGKQIWSKRTNAGSSGSPTVPSDLLVDGKLILKLPHSPKKGKGKGMILRCLDPQTGDQLWETPPLAKISYDWGAGTPAVMRLTNGEEQMTVLCDSGGSIVRLDDGKVLIHNLGAAICHGGATVIGDLVVYHRPFIQMFRLRMVDRDRIAAQRLWITRMGTHGMGYHGGTVCTRSKLFYHETGFGHFRYKWPFQTQNGTGESRKWIVCKDLHTGEEVAHWPAFRKATNFWSLSSVTKDQVYMVSGDHIFTGSSKAPMFVSVATNDRDPIPLAYNVIERYYGGPVFDGEEMFIRGYHSTSKIAYTGDAGRAYEAEVVANTVLDQIQARAPKDAPTPVALTAASQRRPEKGTPPISSVEHNRAPHAWSICGPFPGAALDEAVQGLRAHGAMPVTGVRVSAGGVERPLTLLTSDSAAAKDAPRWEVCPTNFSLLDEQRRLYPLGKIFATHADSAVLLRATWRSVGERVMRYEQLLPGVRVWIGDIKLQDGQRLAFTDGYHSVLVAIDGTAFPTDGRFSPRLFDSSDPAAELTAWNAFVDRIAPQLDAVLKHAPESAAARRVEMLRSSR